MPELWVQVLSNVGSSPWRREVARAGLIWWPDWRGLLLGPTSALESCYPHRSSIPQGRACSTLLLPGDAPSSCQLCSKMKVAEPEFPYLSA